MELFVLNKSFESIAVVDTFESLIWSDRYDEWGDFELYMSTHTMWLEFLQQDFYLWNADTEHTMIIEQIEIDSDAEDGDKLTVTGRSLESIIERRIIWGQKVFKGKLQDFIRILLEENIINPSDPDRKINNFVFVESTDETICGIEIDVQYTGDNLYDVIHTLCNKNDVGFKIILNNAGQFEFSLYIGENRSYEQDTNPYVIFSPEFDNIINSSYVESKKNYKNVALIAGEGEGADRTTSSVGSGVGLERRELFVDARDISSDVGDGVVLTPAEYKENLNQRGSDRLSEYPITKAFEGEAETSTMFVYGIDFFMGDIVQVANEYGHESVSRISELVMSQNEEGTYVCPTFKTIEKG